MSFLFPHVAELALNILKPWLM